MPLVPVALLEKAGPEHQDTGGSSHLSHCVIWFSHRAFAFPDTHHYPVGQFKDDFNANELLRRQSSPRDRQELLSKEQNKAAIKLCHQSALRERLGGIRAWGAQVSGSL